MRKGLPQADTATHLKQGGGASPAGAEPPGPQTPCSCAGPRRGGAGQHPDGSSAVLRRLAGHRDQHPLWLLPFPSMQAADAPASFKPMLCSCKPEPVPSASRGAKRVLRALPDGREESWHRHYKTSPTVDLIWRAGTGVTITHRQLLDKTRQVMPEFCQERSRRWLWS